MTAWKYLKKPQRVWVPLSSPEIVSHILQHCILIINVLIIQINNFIRKFINNFMIIFWIKLTILVCKMPECSMSQTFKTCSNICQVQWKCDWFFPEVVSWEFSLKSMVTKCTEFCLNLCLSLQNMTVFNSVSHSEYVDSLQHCKREKYMTLII